MILGVPRELYPGERRVALTPAAVKLLGKAKVQVAVEAGAGVAAGFPDAEYTAAGAKVADDRAGLFAEAGVLAVVRTAGADPLPTLPHASRGEGYGPAVRSGRSR